MMYSKKKILQLSCIKNLFMWLYTLCKKCSMDTQKSRISYTAFYIVQEKKYSTGTPNMAADSMEQDTQVNRISYAA